jgi:cytochrome d ubiquinol oxidase subunit I
MTMEPATETALLLARIQFAANISFHILFPTITIAMGWVLFYLRVQATRTGEQRFLDSYRLWVKVFALSFALGVVSGVTMSFQFGTNWPGFMERVGNVAGPLLAYEVLTAFFLEATFLAIMLFGIGRVSTRLHTIATFLVAFGTTMSAFWIIVLNSWMHTPQGFEMRPNEAGVMVAYVTDWAAVVLNPSMPYRFAHMLIASFLTCAFLIAGLASFQWLRGNRGAGVMTSLRLGVTLAAVLIPVQIFVGDLHGLNTLEHQPAKVAAMEGIWYTEQGAGLRLFGIPDQEARTNHFEVVVPNVASLILTHEWNGTVRGLTEFAPKIPPVAPVFFAFRIMVGIGLLMLLVSWTAWWLLRRRGAPTTWLAWGLVGMTFSGWIATLAGWYVTEIGRQPWLVQGVLTTAQAAGPVPAGTIGASLAMYLIVYGVLLVAYIATLFHLAKKDGAADTPVPDGLPPKAAPVPMAAE